MAGKSKFTNIKREALIRTRCTFRHMHARCGDPKHTKFSHYGARGIKVCPQWSDVAAFLADMGLRPEQKTLDRFPNRLGNYEPANCRWATAAEQNANRDPSRNPSASNKLHALFGELVTVGQSALKRGISRHVIRDRMRRHGLSLEQAVMEIESTSTKGASNMTVKTASRRVCHGITIAPNQFSAAWRRKWWIVDIGNHAADVRKSLIRAAGVDPEDVTNWQPNVSFPSLTAACKAINSAVEVA